MLTRRRLALTLNEASRPPQTRWGRAWRGGGRAVVIGCVLVVALSWLSIQSNLRYGRYITAASLPNGATFMFVATLCVNALWRCLPFARLRQAALTLPELALIFGMLYISAALPQASVAETLVTLAVAPTYLPRDSPHVGDFDGAAPAWLLVQDKEAAKRFYEGWGPRGGPVPWAAWITPLLGWSAFVILLLCALACVSQVFAHRWVREEKISFPLMDLPLELLGGPGSARTFGEPPLWRSPLFYLAAAIPAAMITVGQFHSYYPSIPKWEQIPTFAIGEAWTSPPLSALSQFSFSIWPLVIGIAYLLNREIALSIWAFHLLFWLQLYLWAVLGYTPQASEASGAAGAFNPLDWIHNTEFGGAVTLAVALLGTVRKEAARSVRSLFSRSTNANEPPLTVPPGAVVGFGLANAGMLAWSWAAGASPVAVAVYLAFLYAITVAMGRMVASGGLYLVDNGYEPQSLLYGFAGPGAFSKGTHFALTGQEALFGRADMSFLYFAVNETKLAHDTGTDALRWRNIGLAVSVGAALVSAYVFILVLSYRYGAVTFRAWPLTWRAPEVFDRTATFLHPAAGANGPTVWTWAGTAVGVLIALVLVYLNRTFLWWPLSPFGFAVASSWNIANQIWSSVFLGWLIASLVRRYGGLVLYRRLRPFFLGLIAGDAVSVCLMALLEIAVGIKG